MNVSELVELLSDLDQQAEVRLATQPGWPLAFEVGGVADSREMALDTKCEEHDNYSCDDCAEEVDPVAWIVEGVSSEDPYAPRAAWASCP